MQEPDPSAVALFGCTASLNGDTTVIWLAGELDLATRDVFVDAVSAVMKDARIIVADVTGLTFIDSAGLSSMVRCRNAAIAAGRRFGVRGAAARCTRHSP